MWEELSGFHDMHSLASVSFRTFYVRGGGSVLQELTFQVSQGYCQPLRGTASMDPSLICNPLPNLAGHPGSWGHSFGDLQCSLLPHQQNPRGSRSFEILLLEGRR